MADDTPYPSEFTAVIRHPAYEKGQASTFHATLTRWAPDMLGNIKAETTPPMTPDALARAGFTLEKIVDAVLASAVHEATAAKAEVATLTAKVEAVEADYTQMAGLLREAAERTAIAERVAGAAVEEKQAAERNSAALIAELDALKAPSDEPANPLLNKISFGLLGN